MSLRRKRIRRGASITSLIDVIFLLLLFFMLASTFSKHAEIEIISSAEGKADGDLPNVVQLLVLTDSLQIGGEPISDAALITMIDQAMQEPNSIIAIELGSDITTQRLMDILLILSTVPNARVHIVEPS